MPGEGESLIKVSFSFIFQAKQSPCFQGLGGVICGSSLLKFNPKMFSRG